MPSQQKVTIKTFLNNNVHPTHQESAEIDLREMLAGAYTKGRSDEAKTCLGCQKEKEEALTLRLSNKPC